MTDEEYRQEHRFDSMLLWRCEYDLDGEFDICTWVSYMWSTSNHLPRICRTIGTRSTHKAMLWRTFLPAPFPPRMTQNCNLISSLWYPRR